MATQQEIRNALLACAGATGSIDPHDVVYAAQDPDNALHNQFPWDDAVAAHAHRVDIARRLIARYITVTVIRPAQRVVTPVYVRSPTVVARQASYDDIREMDQVNADRVIDYELKRIAAAVARIRGIASVHNETFPGIYAAMARKLCAIACEQHPAAGVVVDEGEAPPPPRPGRRPRRRPGRGPEPLRT